MPWERDYVFYASRLWSFPLLGVLLFAPLTTTFAADVTVNCPADSFQTTLDSLGGQPSTITVHGDCNETPSVNNFDNLNIQGDGTSSLGGLLVFGSRNMRIQSLTFRGQVVTDLQSSWIEITQCDFEGGLQVGRYSSVYIKNSKVAARNGNNGIGVSDALVMVTDSEIVGDGTANGLLAGSGARLALQGNTTVENNSYGILAVSARAIEIDGPVTIKNNGTCGVYLIDGTPGSVTNGATIRDNGTAEHWCGGIWVERNASVRMTDGTVRHNDPFGIAVMLNSSAMVEHSTIKGNLQGGVRLIGLSSLWVKWSDSTVKNNGKYDLVCTPDSRAYSTKQNIGKMACPGYAGSFEDVMAATPGQ